MLLQSIKLSYEHVAMHLLILSHHKELQHVLSKQKSQLEMSAHVHKTMLLDQKPSHVPGCSIGLITNPSQEIDGDFIEFSRPIDHIFDFAIGDVMGKGLPAALIGIAVKSQIHRFDESKQYPLTFERGKVWKEEIQTPHEILTKMHESIVPQLIDLDYFVSLIYGRFDLRKRAFSFVDCGFTKPLFYRAKNKKVIPLAGTNFPLGIVRYNAYNVSEVPFEEGDLFVFYSDGVSEALSPQGELYGEKRLIELVQQHAEKPPQELLEIIKASALQFVGKELLDDDITLLAIKIDRFPDFHSKEGMPVKFNSMISQLPALRELVREYCYKAPGDYEALAAKLELVLDEAFSNIVKHGYGNKQGNVIFLHPNMKAKASSLKSPIKAYLLTQLRFLIPIFLEKKIPGMDGIDQTACRQNYLLPQKIRTGMESIALF